MERHPETHLPMTTVVQCATGGCDNSVSVLIDEQYGHRCCECHGQANESTTELNINGKDIKFWMDRLPGIRG